MFVRRDRLPGAVVALALLLATSAARAQPPTAVDRDGDGDVDQDDALIEAAAGETIEVVGQSDGERLEESSRAVTVVDLEQARERTADLGEVLSRAQGVQVRRSGGLGSETRFSLNGLYDDQIRFFVDGIPLELAGWAGGVADLPVELVERVDVYRGVVPVALGADALGGAIDLVTDPRWEERAAASYQLGSFGTHRASAVARGRHDDTGLALGAAISGDLARNDYPVDVEVPDAQGRLTSARVPRFHDGYRAGSASLEGGLVARGPIDRALVRLFGSHYDKELQHNAVMTVPYGEVEYGGDVRGGTADVALTSGPWQARVVVGAAYERVDFEDLAESVYSWRGDVVRSRTIAGELEGQPIDQRTTELGLFARASVARRIGEHGLLRLALAPTRSSRGGVDRLDPNPDGRDPIEARRDLTQLVVGLEHELSLLDDDLENVAFVKAYATRSDAEDVRSGGAFVPVGRDAFRLGLGDSARYRLGGGILLKASYEWATRLPSADEVFGDGVLVRPNLDLRPEVSHNANLGARVERETSAGALAGEVSLFARLADQLILLLGNDRYFSNQNVWAARILGAETTAGWEAPGGWARVDGSATVQDIRNASDQGTFGDFEGDRVPNRPWLLGSLGASARRRGVLLGDDEVTVFGASRYVRRFYRGWESLGAPETKQVVPSQLVHGLGLTYAVRGDRTVTTTVEAQNLTDARAYDSFGVERPGRAFYIKVTGEL